MGNVACSCAHRRHPSEPDKLHSFNFNFENLNLPKTTTPYDNYDINTLIMEDKFPFNVQNKEDDISIDTPPITQKFINQNGAPNALNSVCPRTHLTSLTDTRRTTSLFSAEDATEEDNTSKQINSEIYDIILKEFLVNNYPISNEIIHEMITRNLLLPKDASILLSYKSNQEKSFSFLNNFVFSEVNICKLATFLHVLLKEKSHILLFFNKSERYFRSIVDHIYYVVNLLTLLTECSEEEDKLGSIKSLTSMVNLNCVQNVKVLKKKPLHVSEDLFYVRIYMNNATLPSRFWKDFACINEHFHCCQELILSSCNLRPEDMFYLTKALLVSGIVREIDVSSNPIADEGVRHLETLLVERNSLVSLNIACCSITSIGMEGILDALSNNYIKGNLRNLNISHNDLNNMTEKCVLILTKLPLSSLEMKSINLRHQRLLYQSLKLNYSLKKVDFSGNKLQNNDVTYLAAGLAYNMRLKHISLAMTGILKSDCLTINNTLLMNKTIVSIDLSDNLIGDEGAEALKDILTMKKTLKEVSLRRCGISLHGILVLLRNVSDMECNVKHLDLCYNHSPRMSIMIDGKDIIRKIEDVLRHISLVKDIRILLWGTFDEKSYKSPHADCLDI